MNLIINGISYIMPMGDLNKELLNDLVNDNNIVIDELGNNLEDKYLKIKRVFDLLCRSVVMFKDVPELSFSSIINDLCQEMWRMDSLIEFQANHQNYQKAINNMIKFMTKILELFQIEYKSEKRRVI